MIHIGSDAEFRRAGEFLRQHYTETMLTAEFGVASIFDFHERKTGVALRSTLARLFFGGAAVSPKDMAAAIPDEILHDLMSLGLIETSAGQYTCPVLLYPIRGVLVASDRLASLLDTSGAGVPATGLPDPSAVPRDFVYLALTTRTKTFLESLPERPCDALLDIGAGSGAAALIASRYSKKCWASDISARSTLFATFNGRLNGITNFHAVEGSLYEPVTGLTFDRIVCHPPYDPSLTDLWTFCDGGYDGEFVLKGAIAGLGAHLRPGGQFYAQARGGDRKDHPLEQRMREWLGDAHTEFDIAIVVRDIVQPEEYAIGSVMTMSRRMEDYEAYMKRFKEFELERLVYCNMLIERKTEESDPLTLRRSLGKTCTSAELEWLIRSQRELPALRLEGCTPVMASGLQLLVRHHFESGELRPVEYLVGTTAPFSEDVSCPPWVARLVAACDGKHTSEQIYAYLREQGPIQPHEFEAALKRLIAIGAVERGAIATGA
jgi:SAM-dependent methyltransferase